MSRKAFRDLSPLQAADTARARFGRSVTEPLWRAPWAAADGHLAGFRNPYVAEFKVDGQPGVSLIDSSLPLTAPDHAGSPAPIDVDLEAHGEFFEPRNTLVGTRFPSDIQKRISLDEGALEVGIVGATASARPLGSRLFYGNAMRDGDIIVAPTMNGFGLYAQLRSPEAPETIALNVAARDAKAFEITPTTAGGARVVDAPQTLATVSPPLAVDAQGTQVDARYEVDGDRLLIRVDHADKDLAYPILVDPVWDYQLTWRDNASIPIRGWSYYTPWPSHFSSATNGAYGRGLYISSGNNFYYATTWGWWTYGAPGRSHIYRFDWGPTHHFPYSSSAPVCLTRGLVNGGSWENGIPRWSTSGAYQGTGTHTSCSTFLEHSFYTCLRSDCAPSYDRVGNFAAMQQWVTDPAGNRYGANPSYLSGFSAWLTDGEDPTVTTPASATVNDPSRLWTVSFSDPGLGVRSFEITAPNDPSWDQAQSADYQCAGSPGWTCPGSGSTSRSYGNLVPGSHLIRAKVWDANQRVTTREWTVTIPTTETTFELSSAATPEAVAQGASTAGAELLEMGESGSDGGYLLRGEPSASAVASYRQSYAEEHGGTGTPPVTTFRLRGSIPTSSLGALASNVTTRNELDLAQADLLDTAASDPEGATTYPDQLAADDAYAETLPEDPRVDDDAVASSAADWSPTYGKVWTYNTSGDRPRHFLLTLTWSKRSSLDAFDRTNNLNYAYEHDLKLVNRDNPGALKHPFCFGNNDNFWAHRGGGIYWRAKNGLGAAKPYFDTDDSDSCETQDFTIGLYEPLNLTPRRKYEIVIHAKAGNKASSPYILAAQRLPKTCAFNPGCVNPTSRGGSSQLLVGESKGRTPECRRWRKGRQSRPC